MWLIFYFFSAEVDRHAGRIIELEYNGGDVKETFMFVGKVHIFIKYFERHCMIALNINTVRWNVRSVEPRATNFITEGTIFLPVFAINYF
jgi:hypothetical protein